MSVQGDTDNTEYEQAMSMDELVTGIKLGLKNSGPAIISAYVKLPFGLILMLLPLYGLNKVMVSVAHISLPSSVLCMLILFFGLLLLERICGTKRASAVLHYVDIPCGWCLRWINIFFTPAFTTLPLSNRVSAAEAFEIAGVFVIGFLVMLAGPVYFVKTLQLFFKITRKTNEVVDDSASEGLPEDSVRVARQISEHYENREPIELQRFNTEASQLSQQLTRQVTRQLSKPEPAFMPGISRQFSHATQLSVDQEGLQSISVSQAPSRSASIRSESPETTNSPMPLVNDTAPPYPSLRSRHIASFIALFLDWCVYLTLFMIGIVIYFTTSYPMPLHLGIVVCCFRASLLTPPKYKKVFHPILVTGGSSMLLIYIFALVKGANVMSTYRSYKTGNNYLTLFDSDKKGVDPGAGDVLSTLLDCSIVALATPMYRYRTELKRFFWILTIPSITFGAASFFVYPPLCYACGIHPTRALAFMARSVTLALALPIVDSIQGSQSLVSVVGILSGIVGALFGLPLLGKYGMRVRNDDYVTRGVSMGISSSAVGAAHLLNIDPRASALSTLVFFLYGMVMVIMSVIPPLVNIVRGWVDLAPLSH